MSWTHVCRALFGALAITAAASSPARAQDYPTKPVTIVVPLAAGSGMASLVRLYADKLQGALGMTLNCKGLISLAAFFESDSEERSVAACLEG